MNLTKYNIEALFAKAKNVLCDYASCKKALELIPDSSVLGYLSVKASTSFKAKMYERYKTEMLGRAEATKDIKAALQQLEKKYGYRVTEDME